MPKPLFCFDVEDFGETCLVRVHDNVGDVPQRDFAVEANLVRSHLAETGQRNLLIEVQPASALTADQFRGLVFLLREVRQRGGTGAFCGGGAETQRTLSRFGFSKPADWFAAAGEAFAAVTGMVPAATTSSGAAAVAFGALPGVPYGIATPPPYRAIPGQFAAAPPAVFAPAPISPFPLVSSQPAPAPAAGSVSPSTGWKPPQRGQFMQAHELTLRAHHRQPVLEAPPACAHLAEQIRNVSDQHRFSVWAFVFMPDHFHLLVQSRQLNYDIGGYLEAIRQAFHEKAVEIVGEHAPQVLGRLRRQQGSKIVYDFWQKSSGQNRNVEYTLPMRPLIDHLHENPVRRGLVERAIDWKWSSAGAYAGAPLPELQPDPVPPELLGP